MDKKEELAEEIEELTDYPVNVGYGDFEGKRSAGMEIWFNDMFAWAYSHNMAFTIPGEEDLDVLKSKFMEWYEKEGKAIFKRFNDVKYPERDKKGRYIGNEVDRYFKENCVIGADLEKSINEFCGIDINDDLNVEEGTE